MLCSARYSDWKRSTVCECHMTRMLAHNGKGRVAIHSTPASGGGPMLDLRRHVSHHPGARRRISYSPNVDVPPSDVAARGEVVCRLWGQYRPSRSFSGKTREKVVAAAHLPRRQAAMPSRAAPRIGTIEGAATVRDPSSPAGAPASTRLRP